MARPLNHDTTVTTIEQFERVVTERLQAVDAERHAVVKSLAEEMQKRTRLATEFATFASRLHETIILPRVNAVVRQFADAKVASTTTPLGIRTECQLARSARYPASTKLSFSIGRSPEATRGSITYSLKIIPILMAFEGECHRELDPTAADENQITEWVEARLLDFVDNYLRIGSDPHYQRENLQIDPVCGMSVSAGDTDEMLTVGGHAYYFCSAPCREQFAREQAPCADRSCRSEVTI